jgi:Plasmid pRiA4b ORF-3-like protein
VTQQPVFQLRIRLEGINPPVWRRLLVPGGVRLAKLHDIFQAAMGWTNSHLHSFTIDDQLYGMQVDEFPEEELDETEYTVLVALRGGVRRFVYDYDFGDSWTHEVVVEDVTWAPHTLKFGVCLDGEGACPPEDVGGIGGYAHFLEALADPLHEEHDDMLVWAGFKFDPAEFSVATANAALQRVR